MKLSKFKILKAVLYGGSSLEEACNNDIQYLTNNPFDISGACRVCGERVEENDFDICQSYWIPFTTFVIHKECKPLQKQETYECQKIDANCNDCKYFNREKNKGKLTEEHDFLGVTFHFEWNEERKDNKGNKKILTLRKEAVVGDEVTFNGTCTKKNIGTIGIPNTSTGYSCFVHRKD